MARDDDWEAAPPAAATAPPSSQLPSGRSALTEIEEHWRDLKALSPHLPRRADIDAGQIASALPHAFVLDRGSPGAARIRIAGRVIAELLGGSPRGLPLSLLFTPSSRPGLQAWIERCFDGPALVDILVQAAQGPIRQPLRGRLLLLPMMDREGAVTRIFGGLLLNGAPRRSDPRFELADAVPRVETVAPAAAPRRGAAHAAEPVPLRGLSESERPYLRLVVSNR